MNRYLFYDTKSVISAVFYLSCVLLVTHSPVKFDSLHFDMVDYILHNIISLIYV